MHSSAINITMVNNRAPLQSSVQNTGPAKPARAYKSINRSKSFNVHGLNGTNNPSPIYMEKANRSNINHRALYRSNPHLNEDKTQLRSPSIVNLVSRSQRDLTKIDENTSYNGNNNNTNYNSPGNLWSGSSRDVRRGSNSGLTGYRNGVGGGNSSIQYSNNIPVDRRAQSLLRTTSDNYRTEFDSPLRNGHFKYGLERNIQRERESSLGSRSPVTINKDTASIVRRGSSSTEDDPYRSSANHIQQNYTKKSTVPIEKLERKSLSSRFRSGELNSRYANDDRRDSGPIVIEVRRN